MASEIEEIEAILREHIYATHGSTQCGRYTDYEVVELGGVSEGAQAISSYIAALRSKDREDGAREIVLPSGWVAVPERPTRAMRDAAARAIGGNWDLAHDAYVQALAARPALPLFPVRTENGDA